MKIFLDTGSLKEIKKYSKSKFIKGFTTNPSLLKKNQENDLRKFLIDYKNFSKKPISIEITEKSHKKIYNQIFKLNEINKNIFIKVPYYDHKGDNLLDIISVLISKKININVTAVFSKKQINELSKILNKHKSKKNNVIISIFCGRIADTLRDPSEYIKYAKVSFGNRAQVLWASVRQVYNLMEASNCNTDIITLPLDTLKKMHLKGFSLEKYSKITSEQFFADGKNILY